MKNNEDGGISDAVITTTGVLVTAVVTTTFCAVTVVAPQALCCLFSAASAAISLGVFAVMVGPFVVTVELVPP